MASGRSSKVTPYDSFVLPYKVITWAGHCKLRNPKSEFQKRCHHFYRYISLTIVVIYNLQHIVFIIQNRNNRDRFIEGVMMEIPELNLILKITAMWKTSSLDQMYDLLHDPIFAANSIEDEALLVEHTKSMRRLAKIVIWGLTLVLFPWALGPIFKRMQDETTVLPSYMPFEINSWKRFALSWVIDSYPVLWIGYGHMLLDGLIAIYYAQSVVQLKIIKQNLEHIFDWDHIEVGRDRGVHQYVDVLDKNLKDRFVYYVKRYEKVAWFTKEINTVFNAAISFQFFWTVTAICLVVYLISNSDGISVQFIFYICYYMIIQSQGFIYCFYGGQIQYESSLVVDAVYLSNWLALSPKFRRLLLFAKTRWVIPIAPKVSSVLPLAMTTMISLTRSAYTMYTVLKTNNSNKMHG